MNGLNILRFTFLGIGIVLLGVAAYLWHSGRTYLAEAIEVEGRVVSNISYDDDEGTMYSPLVIFQTKREEKVEFIDNVRSRPAQYESDEIVPVLYLPSDPTDAMIKSFFGLWGAFSIVGGLGLLFALVGFGLLFVPDSY